MRKSWRKFSFCTSQNPEPVVGTASLGDGRESKAKMEGRKEAIGSLEACASDIIDFVDIHTTHSLLLEPGVKMPCQPFH
jgi:hypothetical protein